MSTRRLTKSPTDRVIDGVCGGLGEYFAFDATLVRLLFVAFTLAGGAGLFNALFTPDNPPE